MGEHDRGREAIDRLTRRIVEQGRQRGEHVNPDRARERAVEAAKRFDRKNQR